LKKLLLTLLVVCVGLAFSVSAMAAPTPQNPAILKVSYNAPETLNTDVVQWEQEHGLGVIFKNIVEAGTDGAIKVELYPNSQLGDNRSSVELAMSGGVEAVIGTGVLPGFYPQFEVINIPYLFKSAEIAWHVFDNSQYWADLREDLRKTTGLRLLAMGQNGVRHFTHNSKFIKTPEDLRGEKIRVMESPIFVTMMQAFGANPTPMAFSEVFTAMQQGTIDGQENPLAIIIGNKFYEVQKYIAKTEHIYVPFTVVMNLDKFNSLTQNQQDAILKAMEEATEYQYEINAQLDKEAVKVITDAGSEIIELTAEEKAQWQQIMTEAKIFDMVKNKMDNPQYLDAMFEATK